MGSGIFYSKSANTVKNVKKNGLLRSFLFAGILLFSMPFFAKAQTTPPTFNNGSAQPYQACMNSVNNDITSLFSITDPDFEGETWTLVSGPSSGTVSGFSAFDFSTGGTLTLTTTTIYYTPNSGFTGLDQFVVEIRDNSGMFSTTTVNVSVTPLPSFNIDNIAAVCAGATSTTLTYSALANVGPTTATFINQYGPATWVRPPGVNSVDFDVQGAVGGGDTYSGAPLPGNGGRVTGTLNLPLGVTSLSLYVGQAGANGSTMGAAAGWNGGAGATFYFFGSGGAGGDASDIRMNGNTLADRVVVAGGGGGAGWDSPGASCGGAGGGVIAGSGCNNVSGQHAGGGTNLGGGAGSTYTASSWTPGSNGTFGFGGAGSPQGISGGGGGGWYGGGGGVWNGGGGGSSYAHSVHTTGVVHTPGYNIGDGVISLNYNIPGTFTIIWNNATAYSNGFVDIVGAPLTGSPLTIPLPPGAAPDTYTGDLTIDNGTCTSVTYPIYITIHPIPDVAPVADQVMCDNTVTTPVIFTGAVPGTSFDWTNDNPIIGLPASGSGPIGSFTAVNPTANPIIATITVTPNANGCTGTPVSFTITVYPTPTLTSTLSPGAVCDSAILNYIPTSGTPGTTFTWFRNPVTDIANIYASGSGNPAEYLDNTSANSVTVPYQYVLAANGCFNTQYVNVVIHPTPTLSTSLAPGAICNNTVFNYTPGSATVGTIFTWNRNTVTGITAPPFTGSNNPFSSDYALVNTTSAPIEVPYVYTLYANTCINTQTVVVTVNPTPMLNSGTTPPAICNNTMFVYGPGSATTGTNFSWSRGAVTGILPATNSGIDSIIETLTNTTPNTIPVTYTYTLMANGCSNTQSVVVNVYPKPMLSTATNPSQCDSTIFNYPPASLTPGTTFTWSRAVVTGISNPMGAGTNNPNEILKNTTPNSVVVPYVFTLSANGCTNNQTVNLTVHPTPKLSSSLAPGAICDSATFNYIPASNTAGASFAWFRPYIPGIYAVASSGVGNPNQQLINSTYVVVDVAYTYTITANGCSNEQNVVVKVNPTPKLNPPFSTTVCSGSQLNYVPASYTPGALYAWNRPAVGNITPPTSFVSVGNGEIHETLWNGTLAPITVDYIYRLTIGACPNLYTQTVKVVVNPTPNKPDIITSPMSGNLCAGTMFQNFGAAFPLDKLHYQWSATNAEIYATGSNNQYAIVNFRNPGTAVVTITSNVNGYGCKISNSVTVNVSGETSVDLPEVIYFNGQFICLKNGDGIRYQWGYDDAASLDSTILTGENDQHYNNASPDFVNKRYWVMVTKGGDACWQKAYYNRPTAIEDVNALSLVKVYPNPASDVVNVEINASVIGNVQVEVLNLLGQRLSIQDDVNRKASINVSALPAGVYLIDCYMNGTKIATNRFIKN
ncbi:MAG: cell surface receptor domain protein [Flavipsychrobacter sp.]|jgi:hypothetical protein|nr:cell surface receptor domain protein [Flavipsychrobacter sp.]